MKRQLLAIAVGAAFAATAHAQGSSVQLYGIIDMGVTHFTGVDNGAGGTTSSTGLSSGVQSGSRIGLKGREDLGGGLSTLFDVETGFCAAGTNQDQATTYSGAGPANGFCTGGGFMQRQAWVGLSGNFGTLQGGRMYTLIADAEGATDPFSYGTTGAMTNLSLAGIQRGFAFLRASQQVQYTTPHLGGFTGAVAYSFAPLTGTVPTSTASGSQVPRAWSLQGKYAAGPLTAGVTYLQMTNSTWATDAAGVNNGKVQVAQVFGSYNFGVAALHALYERASGDYAYGTSSGTSAGNNTYWMLGATVPVGRGQIMVSYADTKADQNSVLQPSTVYGSSHQMALGYSYSLSKATDLYASYARMSNDAHMALAIGSATDVFRGVPGQSSTGIAVGIRHLF